MGTRLFNSNNNKNNTGNDATQKKTTVIVAPAPPVECKPASGATCRMHTELFSSRSDGWDYSDGSFFS